MSAGRRGALSRARPDLLGAGVTALLTSALVVLHYRLWETRPGISWSYRGDGLGYQTVIQGALEGHWALHNDRLGYPFGQHTSAYPLPDHLSLGFAKVLGVVTGAGSALVTNLYFFATFPLVALAAYAALRWLGTRREVSVVLAVLYAFAPYHLEHGDAGHLFLSFYVLVPLGTAALIRQLVGQAAFVDRTSGRVGRSSASAWAAVAIAAALGLTGVYYALFFCVLAAGVAVLLALRGRAGLPAAASTVGLAAVTGLVLLVALAPALLASDGTHVPRNAADSELLGLRVARLVLPAVDHRVDVLSSPADELRDLAVGPGSDGTSPLGLVAAAGFVGSLLIVLGGRGTRDTEGASATLVVLMTLTGTAAGLGLLAASVGFTQIRAWNRISIYIGFASIVIVGGWLDRALDRPRPRWLAPAGLAGLLVVGLLDQVPTFDMEAREETIETWQRDDAFFRELEGELPAGAAVFQLPAVQYPEEPPVGDMLDYDHLRGYLHTDDLRWSYGHTKLSEPPWDHLLARRPARELVTGVALAGFDAIYLNRAGYAGRSDPDALVRELVGLLGDPSLRSENSQMLAWDIRPLRERLAAELDPAELEAARADVVDAVSVSGGDGFGPGVGASQWLEGTDGELVVENRTADVQDVVLRLDLRGVAEGEVELRAGELVHRAEVAPDERTRITIPLEVEPGRSTIDIHTTVPADGEDRDRTVQLFPAVVDGGTDLAAMADQIGLP